MTVRVGTCAWADHERFYPKSIKQADRLAYYAEFFSLVEIDSTYYGIPKPNVAQQWVRQTPDTFLFDIKAYRTLTQHDRGEATVEQWESDFGAFQRVLEVLASANKLGIVLCQFPPWFVCSDVNVDYVERLKQRLRDFQVGIEFRNRTWFDVQQYDETIAWLSQLDAVNVVCDEPQVGTGCIPLVPEVTQPDYVMFRLHGRNEETWYQKGLTSSQQRFDYRYSVDEIRNFVPLVQQWALTSAEVHVLMNNNQGDYAVTNALDWLAVLGQPVKERASMEASTQSKLFEFDGI